MLKKIIAVAVVLIMALSFTACENELAYYKTAAKAEIDALVEEMGQENYSEGKWANIEVIVLDHKTEINAAEDKAGVDCALLHAYKHLYVEQLSAYVAAKEQENSYHKRKLATVYINRTNGAEDIFLATSKPQIICAYELAKEKIDAVPLKSDEPFPATIEDFIIEDFTDNFFENNTLVLVPFKWPFFLYEFMDLYTVYTENDKLNFLIEVYYPFEGADLAEDNRVFAVTVSNTILSEYEIGESIIFEAYTRNSGGVYGSFTENSRECLKEAEANCVEHRVSYAKGGSFVGKKVGNMKQWISEITVINSKENLQKYF